MPTVAERLLKVGIKAAVPIVGDLVAAALEQTSGYLLDQQAERKANDLHARLLKALNARFQQAEASGILPHPDDLYAPPQPQGEPGAYPPEPPVRQL